MFIAPGATRISALISCLLQGKGAGLTALSGIANRIKQWTASASSGGTAITPRPADKRAPAAVSTAAGGAAGGTGAVTSGTTAVVVKSVGCGASGPGGWVAANPDASITLDGGATMSTDGFSSSGTASLNFEWSYGITE